MTGISCPNKFHIKSAKKKILITIYLIKFFILQKATPDIATR
jgi:hypothetical protein